MHLGYDKNAYGTLISKHRCDTCGTEFSLCPAVPPEKKGWENCLAPKCASYDVSRDVDKMLESGEVELVRTPPTGQA